MGLAIVQQEGIILGVDVGCPNVTNGKFMA